MRICILPKFKPSEISGVAAHARAMKKHLPQFGVEFVDSINEADLVVVEAIADSPKVSVYVNHGGFLPQPHPLVIQNLVVARRVISVAEWVTKFYRDRYKIEPIIIPNGVDLEEFDAIPKGEFCERFGVKPGFFLWAKNVIDSVRNPADFIKMARRMPDRQFVMTLFPDRQSPPANVRVVGLLEWEWMKRALKDCGCLALLSSEVHPVQMLEAWACSKPVLGKDMDGVGESVAHKKTGWLATDFEGLMEGAEYIGRHSDDLGKRGRREVEREFQWKDIARRNFEVYEEVLEEKRREGRKVTVTIPCYNLKQYVGRAVNSVLNQAHDDLELVIVDDGSTDGSSEFIRSLIRGNERVELIRQGNRGLAGALNRGLEAGDGKYCLILSADDAIRPDYLQKAVGILERDDRIGYVYSNMEVLVDRKSHIIRCGPSDLETLKRQNTHAYCYVFRRKFFERTGGYKDINPSYEDYEFNLHITKLGAKGHHISEPLFIYLKRDDGREAQSRGMGKYLRALVHGYHPDLYGTEHLITVVTPCYNHAEFIKEAIESVTAQTWPHWEMVVVDDGSTEPLRPTIRPWLEAYPGRIRLVRQENRGLAEARNTGIREAKDGYIALLDADDKFMPTHLEKSLARLLETGAGYTYADFRNFGTAGDSVFTMPEYDFDLLLRNCFHISSLLFHKRVWEQAIEERGFGYDPKMRWGWEDWEWALWMGKKGHCGARVDEPTYLYRQHEFSMRKSLLESHRHEMRHQMQENHIELFRGGELPMGCCPGGRRAPARGGNPRPNPGNPGNPGALDYVVTYTGNRMGKLTKVGPSRTVYRFSADPKYRKQFVAAQDAPMFQKDPQFHVEARKKAVPPKPKPKPKPKVEAPMKPLEDDLSRIHGISADRAKTLRRLDIKSFNGLATQDPEELALSLAVQVSTIKRWQTQAKKLIGDAS